MPTRKEIITKQFCTHKYIRKMKLFFVGLKTKIDDDVYEKDWTFPNLYFFNSFPLGHSSQFGEKDV